MAVIFFWAMHKTDCFTLVLHRAPLSAPGHRFPTCLTCCDLPSVYANWGFARIKGIGSGWAGVVWLYNTAFYFLLDLFKFLIRFVLSGRAWELLENKVTLKGHVSRW